MDKQRKSLQKYKLKCKPSTAAVLVFLPTRNCTKPLDTHQRQRFMQPKSSMTHYMQSLAKAHAIINFITRFEYDKIDAKCMGRRLCTLICAKFFCIFH